MRNMADIRRGRSIRPTVKRGDRLNDLRLIC
jgi:hypothetical protein